MGLFDYLNVQGADFVCSEGHDLSVEEFQTKDLGSTMGSAFIDEERITITPGDWGEPPKMPFLGRMHIYTTCSKCPAFVQATTQNLCATWVEFEVTIVDDKIRSVTRISPTTAEYLETEPKKPYMVDCLGPMPYEEAYRIHLSRRLT